jgi:hypothetical protein
MTTTAWAIKGKKGGIFTFSVRRTRDESIRGFAREDLKGFRWKDFYRDGYRCVKISISINEVVKR